MGYCYYSGEGVKKDLTEALKWCRKSAEQGFAEAECSLGYCYQNGEGVKKDLAEAEKWYRKAADHGKKDAKEALEKLKK